MLSAKEAREITGDSNNNGVEDTVKLLEKRILKQSQLGYNKIFVSLSDLGKTEGRVSKVIRELNKYGYVILNDRYIGNDGHSGKIITW